LSGPPLTVYARGEMAAPIFISHPSKDGNLAALVCGALETRGLSCWISSRDIAPGDNYQVAIVRAIRAAKAMVLIFSANANNSDEIKKELALADQSRLVVIPVRIEDVAPTRPSSTNSRRGSGSTCSKTEKGRSSVWRIS
jgi:hypothetical protein